MQNLNILFQVNPVRPYVKYCIPKQAKLSGWELGSGLKLVQSQAVFEYIVAIFNDKLVSVCWQMKY